MSGPLLRRVRMIYDSGVVITHEFAFLKHILHEVNNSYRTLRLI